IATSALGHAALATAAGAQFAYPVGKGDEKSAPLRPGRSELQFTAVSTHKLSGDGKPKPGAARARRALEGVEKLGTNLVGNSRAVVADLDAGNGTFAPGLDGDGTVGAVGIDRLVCLDCFDRVAHKIAQYPEDLVSVGVG